VSHAILFTAMWSLQNCLLLLQLLFWFLHSCYTALHWSWEVKVIEDGCQITLWKAISVLVGLLCLRRNCTSMNMPFARDRRLKSLCTVHLLTGEVLEGDPVKRHPESLPRQTKSWCISRFTASQRNINW